MKGSEGANQTSWGVRGPRRARLRLSPGSGSTDAPLRLWKPSVGTVTTLGEYHGKSKRSSSLPILGSYGKLFALKVPGGTVRLARPAADPLAASSHIVASPPRSPSPEPWSSCTFRLPRVTRPSTRAELRYKLKCFVSICLLNYILRRI